MDEKAKKMMMKIIEAKKEKSSKQGNAKRPGKVIGETRKAHNSGKPGGVFDK